MTNQDWLTALQTATDFLRPYAAGEQSIGIVLGSGLGALMRHTDISHAIPYSKIPHFPAATVEFHKGQLIFGRVGGRAIIAMQGRFHYYEGYSMQEITFPVRVMKALGCSHLLLSNAAGGINASYRKGDLVLIDDHINLQTDSPLRGLNDAQFGQRFVDMSAPYDAGLMQIIGAAAAEQGIGLQTGVYAAVTGPNLETRAEYRFLRTIGADLVGMSTVPEVIVANQVGLPCAAISVVTDECNPDNLKPVDIAEIIEAAGKADEKLSALLAAAITRIGTGTAAD
jgi:purine-nucleoside phosphorylase